MGRSDSEAEAEAEAKQKQSRSKAEAKQSSSWVLEKCRAWVGSCHPCVLDGRSTGALGKVGRVLDLPDGGDCRWICLVGTD